jgi:DNA-binding MarR family transcriptional regulator
VTSDPDNIPHRDFAWALHDVFRLFQRAWNRRLKASGTGISPAQCRVLATLYREGGCTQTELAEDVEMDKAPLGRLLDRMEELGFVERRADPSDRRVRRVYQTGAAEMLDEPMWSVASGLFERALNGLTPVQIATLMALLEHLKQNLLVDEDLRPAE